MTSKSMLEVLEAPRSFHLPSLHADVKQKQANKDRRTPIYAAASAGRSNTPIQCPNLSRRKSTKSSSYFLFKIFQERQKLRSRRPITALSWKTDMIAQKQEEIELARLVSNGKQHWNHLE